MSSRRTSRMPSPLNGVNDPVLQLLKSSAGLDSSSPASVDAMTTVGRALQQPSLRVATSTASVSSQSSPSATDTAALEAQARRFDERVKAGEQVIAIQPDQIRDCPFLNRDPVELTAADPEYVETRNSIQKDGQDNPIWVTLLEEPDPPYQFELIAGRRRRAICRELGIPVLALVKASQTPIERAMLMWRENADRKDISHIAYGRMFRDWLDRKWFDSAQAVADRIGRDRTVVSRYLSLGALPDEIVRIFQAPRDISLRWGDKLVAAVRENKAGVLEAAERIKAMDPKPPAKQIYEMLISGGQPPANRSLREVSIRVGQRVPLKIAYGEDYLRLKTLIIDDDTAEIFRTRVAKFAEEVIRELAADDPENFA